MRIWWYDILLYYKIYSIVYLYYIYIITPNIVFCWFLLTRPSQSPRTRCFPTRPGRSLRRTPLKRWYNRWYILVLMESWWTCLKLERTAGNHTRLLNFLQNFHGHCWCITVRIPVKEVDQGLSCKNRPWKKTAWKRQSTIPSIVRLFFYMMRRGPSTDSSHDGEVCSQLSELKRGVWVVEFQ